MPEKSIPWSETNRSPPETHRWTTEVQAAAFAVATGGPPIIPPVVTESSIGGYRWKLIITPLATDGSTGNKLVSIPSWCPSSVILGHQNAVILDLILS